MKAQQLVKELEQAARQLGLRVRFEKGRFRGGRCTIDDEEQIVLNRHHPSEIHVSILAECLRDQPVETIYLKPAVRQALEEQWQRRGKTEEAAAEAADTIPD
jgi:hypothetical protein